LIKVALDDGVSPGLLAWSRVVLGAAVLLGLAWQRVCSVLSVDGWAGS
jgi:hypothetical protein